MSSREHLSRLLAVEKAAAPPSTAAEDGLERLLHSLAAQTAPVTVGAGSLKLGGLALAKWVGIGFAVGVVGAGATSFVANGSAEPPVTVAPPVAPVAPVAARAAAQESPRELPVAVASVAQATPQEGVPKRALGVASVPAPSSSAPVAAPGLDEELRLITAAKRDLDQGRAHLARVWLDEHRQRFPGGVFALEREGLLVLCACSSQPNASLGRKFAARYPASPMLAQVLRHCGADGQSEPAQPSREDFVEGDK